MNQILNQIIRIDSQAYENKNKNEEFLLKKKQEYEEKVLNYKSENLRKANIKVQTISEEIEAFVAETERIEKEKVNKVSVQIEKVYKKTEHRLIQEVFNRLFSLEEL
ncbi:MAG TPA: hypothetical protein DC024_14245 [Clostridiales bacterium]|nr:hypothetical protein [Clostridiales bacterium]HCS10769.1 hypothetical protein [Clostridiales bacterium]